MNRFMLRSLFAGLVALTLSQSAFADIVYNNGGPDQTNGSEMTGWIQAQDFTFGSNVTTNSVRFWSLENATGYFGSIYWAIYANAGPNEPGTLLGSGTFVAPTRVATGGTLDLLTEYQYDFAIDSIALSSGTTYWLGLHNGPLSNGTPGAPGNGLDDSENFYWGSTATGLGLPGKEDATNSGNGPWADNNGGDGIELAFQISATEVAAVPEAGSLLLCGVGSLMGAAGYRLRRKKAAA